MRTTPAIRHDHNQVPHAAEPGALEDAAPRRAFIFHWTGWHLFARDFLILQLGLALLGLSVAFLRGTGLGQIPWGVVEYALEARLPLGPGGTGFFVVFLVIAAVTTLLALALREPFGWGSVVNFVFFTLVWVDVFEGLVPPLASGIAGQVLYLVAGTLLMATGTALYLSVGAGAGPRDSLNLAIARRLRVGVGVAWTIAQVALLVIGWLLGGAFGLGTFLFALAIGPAVQLMFRLLGVQPSAELWGRHPRTPAPSPTR